MYVQIKDAVVNFFHDQGITIVTIQPEFQEKSTNKKESKLSLNQCLIGCQSIECAPKTCCSTNDLDTIITENSEPKPQEYKKSKNPNKSNSLLSLNVSSLTKFRKMTGSTPDIIKKSVSESHVERFGGDSEISESVTSNVSQAQSSDNFEYKIYEVDESPEINTANTPQKGLGDNSLLSNVVVAEEQNLLAKDQDKLHVVGNDAASEREHHKDTSLEDHQ